MNSNNPFYKQVSLLVQLLPIVGQQACFALKGGTAINLFVRAMPRLSVDIDLAYLPMVERNQALAEIELRLPGIDVITQPNPQTGTLLKLNIASYDAKLK